MAKICIGLLYFKSSGGKSSPIGREAKEMVLRNDAVIHIYVWKIQHRHHVRKNSLIDSLHSIE